MNEWTTILIWINLGFCTPTDAGTEIFMPLSSIEVVLTVFISVMSHVCLCCYVFPTENCFPLGVLSFLSEKSTSYMGWWKFLPFVQTLGVKSISATVETHVSVSLLYLLIGFSTHNLVECQWPCFSTWDFLLTHKCTVCLRSVLYIAYSYLALWLSFAVVNGM